jgi:hypothetical protein
VKSGLHPPSSTSSGTDTALASTTPWMSYNLRHMRAAPRKKVPSVETEQATRVRVLRSGVPGVGEIMDLHAMKKEDRRAANGDYRFAITMSVALEGGKRQRSTKIHLVPKDRTYWIRVGKRYPVKVDSREAKQVEIDWDHFQKLDGPKVLDQIVAKLAPVLKDAGYRRVTSRTFNCVKDDGLIHLIDFQASRWGEEFTVNLAVYVRAFRRRAAAVNEKRVDESDCTFKLRWRISEVSPKGRDIWWRYQEPEKAVREVQRRLDRYVLPHLERYATYALLKNSLSVASRARRARKE